MKKGIDVGSLKKRFPNFSMLISFKNINNIIHKRIFCFIALQNAISIFGYKCFVKTRTTAVAFLNQGEKVY